MRMVWEIKFCMKCIKNLMSSSKTPVFSSTKREGITNRRNSGVSRGRRKDPFAAGAGAVVLMSQRGQGLVSVQHPSEHGACPGAVVACGHVAQCLRGAWHVHGSRQVINNDNDYENIVHVPLGLCKKKQKQKPQTFYIESQL